jgi:hypothetical protein
MIFYPLCANPFLNSLMFTYFLQHINQQSKQTKSTTTVCQSMGPPFKIQELSLLQLHSLHTNNLSFLSRL